MDQLLDESKRFHAQGEWALQCQSSRKHRGRWYVEYHFFVNDRVSFHFAIQMTPLVVLRKILAVRTHSCFLGPSCLWAGEASKDTSVLEDEKSFIALWF